MVWLLPQFCTHKVKEELALLNIKVFECIWKKYSSKGFAIPYIHVPIYWKTPQIYIAQDLFNLLIWNILNKSKWFSKPLSIISNSFKIPWKWKDSWNSLKYFNTLIRLNTLEMICKSLKQTWNIIKYFSKHTLEILKDPMKHVWNTFTLLDSNWQKITILFDIKQQA